MLSNGKYSAWYRTPLGEGTGIVVLRDGNVSGGDTVIAYSGSYRQHGDTFSADIAIKRHTVGQMTVFGIDDVEISLTGKSTATVASCRGKSKPEPGIEMEVTMVRMTD